MKLARADLRVSGVLAKPALLACTSDRDFHCDAFEITKTASPTRPWNPCDAQ
jgi:hypothetical protein